MFVIRITYTVPLETLETQLVAHRAFLDEGYAKNWLLASGPQNPRVGGIILALLKDRTTLEAFLAKDPFALQGYATYEITEFTPVKCHPLLQDWV